MFVLCHASGGVRFQVVLSPYVLGYVDTYKFNYGIFECTFLSLFIALPWITKYRVAHAILRTWEDV